VSRTILLVVLLFICGIDSLASETLRETLRAAKIPTEQFASSELDAKITSYAISTGDPFLLAYYTDNESGMLQPPLRVIRYSRTARDLRRAAFQDIDSFCLGSALAIHEYHKTIFIETHYNPSAGCVIVLTAGLSLRKAISGGLLGVMGADYAVIRGSEIHFMSVHPLHIFVFDLRQNRLEEVYPFKNDVQRAKFSHSIEPHISEKWCVEYNAQCDPQNFNTTVMGELSLNETARVFGFEAEFDANGFGDAALQHIPSQTVVYIFREQHGNWQHRQFQPRELESLFGSASLQELIRNKPNAPFDPASGK